MKRVLITGASGYMGAATALKVLRHTKARLVLPVRGAVNRQQSLLETYPDLRSERVQWCDWELENDLPLSGVDDPSTISHIIHCAADTRFNIDEATANLVNRDGSLKVFEFARRQCPQLESFVYVSTVYASGLKSGSIPEAPLPKEAFANHYERSKWEAETALMTDFSELPWSLVRTATVIADNNSGGFTQQNAVHNTLKLLYYGLMSLVPGQESTPVFLVTGEFCAQTLFAVSQIDRSQGSTQDSPSIFHVCHEKKDSLSLGQLIQLAFESFEKDPDFSRRQVKRPLFVDQEAFSVLSEGVSGFGGSVVTEALQSVTPFANQLFVEKDFENANTRALLGESFPQVDAGELLSKTLQRLIASRWGRKS